MPVNFTDQEWKEYFEKIKQLKPLNDKEWEEYTQQVQLRSKNPNNSFYPDRYVSPFFLALIHADKISGKKKNHKR